MTITIQLPDGLSPEHVSHAEKAANEAVSVMLYRARLLSHGQLQQRLGLSSYETDGVLKLHGGVDEFTADEVWEQVEASLDVSRRVHA